MHRDLCLVSAHYCATFLSNRARDFNRRCPIPFCHDRGVREAAALDGLAFNSRLPRFPGQRSRPIALEYDLTPEPSTEAVPWPSPLREERVGERRPLNVYR